MKRKSVATWMLSLMKSLAQWYAGPNVKGWKQETILDEIVVSGQVPAISYNAVRYNGSHTALTLTYWTQSDTIVVYKDLLWSPVFELNWSSGARWHIPVTQHLGGGGKKLKSSKSPLALEILRLAWTSREPASNFLFKKKEKKEGKKGVVQLLECLPTVY